MTKLKLSIPRLENLSLTQRAVIIFLIIVACLLGLALVGYLSGGWEAEGEESAQLYQGVPIDEHLLQIDKEALEAAYKDHLKLLFSVWLKDDISTVHRINNGLRGARRAYAHAAEQIEKRERAIKR